MPKSGQPLSFLKAETRARCKIIELDNATAQKFISVNTEMFHFLYNAKSIDFSIYFRVRDVMVEFIKKEELGKDLLDQIWNAIQIGKQDISICLLKSEAPKFYEYIARIRATKINRLLEHDRTLDRKTLEVFGNLSDASQLVVRGGINSVVADRVKASAAYLVNNLMDNDNAIATLSRMITHDPTLYDHSASVAMLAAMIGTQCLKKPLTTKEAEIVAQCGLYHDVGKTCVPTAVLNKPGRFTPEEFEVMKTHAALGEEELLKVIKGGTPIDEMAARVAGEHHERFNGKGYPRGRKGRLEENKDGIHLFTRITTIADVYSALLMKRVYKPAYVPQDAVKIMVAAAEAEYDPEIFNAFLVHIVSSLNAQQEITYGKGKGRLLLLDEKGKLMDEAAHAMPEQFKNKKKAG